MQVPKSTVIELVKPRVSEDTVRACEYLLQEARAGRVVGLAWSAIRPGYGYEGDLAGEAIRSPAFTQGMLIQLLLKVSEPPPRRG